MTIDLGFVFLGENVTIIDVPGHEKFIKNMLAGVSTIDFVILVVAADDGIMPQTREHFDILKLLGVDYGVIALTKTDLVEEDWLELVTEDIREFVKGTFLENAPVMPVSSVTGQGITEFNGLLREMIGKTPAKDDKGIFRLWIDRVFVLKGIGTVIAGTVLSGELKPGDKLELLPQGKEVRVRKLQVHNKDVEKSTIGERVAVNLIGVEASEIERGNLLATPGNFEPAYMVNAKLYLLQNSAKPLKSRARIRFHAGTREILGRVVTLDKKSLEPGDSTMVQFRLEEPVALDIGDRYIIRSYSPAYTIGGGTIVETKPKKLKYLPDEELKNLEKLEQADPRMIILHHCANHPLELETIDGLSKEVSMRQEDVESIVDDLIREGIMTEVMEKPVAGYAMTDHLENARKRIADFLAQYHRQFPFRQGIKQSELKNKLFPGINSAVFDLFLHILVDDNAVRVCEETIYLASHEIEFDDKQSKIKDSIEEIYRESGYVTPSREDISVRFPKVKRNEISNIISGMIELGILIEIKTDVERPAIFHRDNVLKAEELLIKTLKEKGEIRLFEFREMINSTRKYTTPLLIYFDRKRLTERDGDVRRLFGP